MIISCIRNAKISTRSKYISNFVTRKMRQLREWNMKIWSYIFPNMSIFFWKSTQGIDGFPRVKLGDEPRVSVSFIFRERGRARKFWKIIPPSGRASRIFKYSIRHRGIRGNVFECEREIRIPAPPSSGEIINDPSVNETFRRATMNASYRLSLRKVLPLTFL